MRRLSSHSRKNKLYFALRELGRAVRSIFLLRYLADMELRHIIQTATTISERFNKFVQWVSFGGDSVIAENIRDEQRKFIKYNHVVANLLVFHKSDVANQSRRSKGGGGRFSHSGRSACRYEPVSDVSSPPSNMAGAGISWFIKSKAVCMSVKGRHSPISHAPCRPATQTSPK